MIPLREYAENINRTWEGILDEPEKHPRFVVRPPNGLLLIWFKNDNEKYPDLKLDLSKCDCAPESLEFWRRKARSGEIPNFTGINSPYEKPINPELTIDTSKTSITQSVKKILEIIT